jgi:hypothetical protein
MIAQKNRKRRVRAIGAGLFDGIASPLVPPRRRINYPIEFKVAEFEGYVRDKRMIRNDFEKSIKSLGSDVIANGKRRIG